MRRVLAPAPSASRWAANLMMALAVIWSSFKAPRRARSMAREAALLRLGVFRLVAST